MSDKPSLKLLLVSPSSRNVESITHGKRWEGTTWANVYVNTDRDNTENVKDALLHSNVNCNARNASFLSESLVVIKQAFASCSSRFRRAFVFEEGEDRGEATYTHGYINKNIFEEKRNHRLRFEQLTSSKAVLIHSRIELKASSKPIMCSLPHKNLENRN